MSPYSPNTPLKILACLTLAATALQPVLAGQFLGGSADTLSLHGQMGELVAWLALAQVLFACVSWWSGRLGRGAVLMFVALFALAGLQVHAGYKGYLSLHIPLGSFLLAASALMTVWVVRRQDRHATAARQAA